MSVRLQSIFVKTHESFPKHIKFLVKIRQSGFPITNNQQCNQPLTVVNKDSESLKRRNNKEQNTRRVKFSDIKMDSWSYLE